VGEAVYPRRAVRSAHDLGYASSVIRAFERVGQRFALEAGGVGKHVADAAARQVLIVERQYNIGMQHALTLALDDLARVPLRLSGALGEMFRLHTNEYRADLRHLGRKPVRLPRLPVLQLGSLDN
jgi:hypothetical protein